MAVQIVKHAILMVVNNFLDALRVSVGPILLVIGLGLLIAIVLQIDPMVLMNADPADPEAMAAIAPQAMGLLVFVVAATLIVLFGLSWIAVAWHRFVLLEEYPRAMPALRDRPVWPYLGRSIVLALLLFLVMVPLLAIVGGVLAPVILSGGVLAQALLSLILGIVFSYLWLRWSLVLPAVAVGRPMGIGESWRATAPLSSTIVGVSALLALLNSVLGLLAAPFGPGLAGQIVAYAASWFTLMVGLSVLTTLYGHVVEGRRLAE